MKIKRPAIENAVRITATDVESKKSKCMTLYDTTPEEVIDAITKAASDFDENDTTNTTDASQSAA